MFSELNNFSWYSCLRIVLVQFNISFDALLGFGFLELFMGFNSFARQGLINHNFNNYLIIPGE